MQFDDNFLLFVDTTFNISFNNCYLCSSYYNFFLNFFFNNLVQVNYYEYDIIFLKKNIFFFYKNIKYVI